MRLEAFTRSIIQAKVVEDMQEIFSNVRWYIQRDETGKRIQQLCGAEHPLEGLSFVILALGLRLGVQKLVLMAA